MVKETESEDKKKSPQKQVLLEGVSEEETKILAWRQQNEAQITTVLSKIKSEANGVLLPTIDHGRGAITYPVMENVANFADILEKLSHKKINLVEKFVYNQFIICPEHRSSFLLNVRLCCPNCNSIDVHKLHLLEHKICGCILEKPRFVDGEDSENLRCPSCKRVIKSPQKELRIPATWYVCKDCKEKFDNALITFHCKEHDHDFTVHDSEAVTVYGYALTNGMEHEPVDQQNLRDEIKRVLSKLGFSVDDDYTIKGKSGHEHKIDICGNNNKDQSVFILINGSGESEIDSKIIKILDTSPKIALIIGLSSITEKTKSIAAKYNVSIISSQNLGEIISEVEKLLSYKLLKLEGGKAK